mgnify:CR=1 FL=1
MIGSKSKVLLTYRHLRDKGFDGVSPYRHGSMSALGYFTDLQNKFLDVAPWPAMAWKGATSGLSMTMSFSVWRPMLTTPRPESFPGARRTYTRSPSGRSPGAPTSRARAGNATGGVTVDARVTGADRAPGRVATPRVDHFARGIASERHARETAVASAATPPRAIGFEHDGFDAVMAREVIRARKPGVAAADDRDFGIAACGSRAIVGRLWSCGRGPVRLRVIEAGARPRSKHRIVWGHFEG